MDSLGRQLTLQESQVPCMPECGAQAIAHVVDDLRGAPGVYFGRDEPLHHLRADLTHLDSAKRRLDMITPDRAVVLPAALFHSVYAVHLEAESIELLQRSEALGHFVFCICLRDPLLIPRLRPVTLPLGGMREAAAHAPLPRRVFQFPALI